MPTYSFPTNIAVGDLGQVTWANSISVALNELGPLVDGKALSSEVVKLTGNQTVAGVKTFSSAPAVPDSSFTIAKTNGLQTALDSKVPAFADPNADAVMFWDDSAGTWAPLSISAPAVIIGTSLLIGGATTVAQGVIEIATSAEVTAGTDALRAVTPVNLKVELDKKANLDSPALTGTPVAPTPTTADNTTKIATTAFVKAQGYAPLASPTLTGDPKAPTPATADNDTSIATTAFVKAQGYALSTDLTAKLDASAAPELIRDTMGTALVAGSNVTITPNDAGDTITIASTGGGGSSSAVQKMTGYNWPTHALAFWSSPVYGEPVGNSPVTNLVALPAYTPPSGTTRWTTACINTTTPGDAGSTITVEFRDALEDLTPGTTVLDTLVFPTDGVVGRAEMNFTNGPLLIPANGMWITILSATGTGARMNRATPILGPGRNWNSGNGSVPANNASNASIPIVFFRSPV